MLNNDTWTVDRFSFSDCSSQIPRSFMKSWTQTLIDTFYFIRHRLELKYFSLLRKYFTLFIAHCAQCSLSKSSTSGKWELTTCNLERIFESQWMMISQWHDGRRWTMIFRGRLQNKIFQLDLKARPVNTDLFIFPNVAFNFEQFWLLKLWLDSNSMPKIMTGRRCLAQDSIWTMWFCWNLFYAWFLLRDQ